MRRSRTPGRPLAGNRFKCALLVLPILTALLLPMSRAAPMETAERGSGREGSWMLCMDLMDLEIPDERNDEYMDLPPIGEVDEPRSSPILSQRPEKSSAEAEKKTREPRESSAAALQPRQPAVEPMGGTPPVLETGRPQGASSLKMMQGLYARPARKLD